MKRDYLSILAFYFLVLLIVVCSFKQSFAAVPSAPSSPTVTATGQTSITVSWSSVSGATQYTLWRSTTSGGSYTQIYCGTGTSYTDSGSQLSANTTYYYELKAGNTAAVCTNSSTNWSGYSSYGSATTQTAVPAPTISGLSSNQTLPVGKTYTLQGTVNAASGDTLTKVTAAVTGPGISGSNITAMTSGTISTG